MPRRELLLAATILLLAAPTAALGSMTGPTTMSADPGGRVAFTLYLFGDGNASIAVDGPAGWPVYAEPGVVELPPEEEYRHVRAADGYRRVRPVRIVAAVPTDADDGTYTVSAAAREAASAPDGSGTALSVSQLRTAAFTVRVGDPAETDGGGVSTIDMSGDGEGSAERSATGGETGFPYLLVLFELAWIAVVAYLLYRRR